MLACYSSDARFEDPVFTLHDREQIGGMWRMLCDTTRAKGRDAWKIEAGDVAPDAYAGRLGHGEPRERNRSGKGMAQETAARRIRCHTGVVAGRGGEFD